MILPSSGTHFNFGGCIFHRSNPENPVDRENKFLTLIQNNDPKDSKYSPYRSKQAMMKSVYQIYTEPANLLDLNSANKTGFGFNKLKAQLKDLSQTACGFKKD